MRTLGMVSNEKEARKGKKNLTDKKQRVVYLFDAIDEETSLEVVRDLIELDQDKKKKPITFYISSPGGYCSYGFAIIDVLERMKSHTKAIALGDVCSMAPGIFVACKERLITPHAFIMLHPVSSGAEDYVKFAKTRIQNAVEVEKMYDEYFLAKTNIPRRLYYRKARNNEWWMTAKEAVKYGIAHKII